MIKSAWCSKEELHGAARAWSAGVWPCETREDGCGGRWELKLYHGAFLVVFFLEMVKRWNSTRIGWHNWQCTPKDKCVLEAISTQRNSSGSPTL